MMMKTPIRGSTTSWEAEEEKRKKKKTMLK